MYFYVWNYNCLFQQQIYICQPGIRSGVETGKCPTGSEKDTENSHNCNLFRTQCQHNMLILHNMFLMYFEGLFLVYSEEKEQVVLPPVPHLLKHHVHVLWLIWRNSEPVLWKPKWSEWRVDAHVAPPAVLLLTLFVWQSGHFAYTSCTRGMTGPKVMWSTNDVLVCTHGKQTKQNKKKNPNVLHL